jgi:hypothetical protein
MALFKGFLTTQKKRPHPQPFPLRSGREKEETQELLICELWFPSPKSRRGVRGEV